MSQTSILQHMWSLTYVRVTRRHANRWIYRRWGHRCCARLTRAPRLCPRLRSRSARLPSRRYLCQHATPRPPLHPHAPKPLQPPRPLLLLLPLLE